jgi:hypothetical protein
MIPLFSSIVVSTVAVADNVIFEPHDSLINLL